MTFTFIPSSDPFSLIRGYSISWFLFLYTYAGYCSLYGSLFRGATRQRYFIIYLVCVALMVIAYGVMEFVETKIPALTDYEMTGFFSRYCSILNFIGSISLFHVFKSIEIKKRWMQKIIGLIAPLTFGVYLIHDNPHMRGIIYKDLLKTSTIGDNWLTIPSILLMAVGIFVACGMIEFYRRKLFALWENNERYNNTIDKIQKK